MECGIPCGVKEMKAVVAKNGAVAALLATEIQGSPMSRQKTSRLSQRIRSSEQVFFKTI